MSASTMPTLCPLAASATARLVVTLLLPTPPLPDEMRRGFVFESFAANGIARPSAWPCACAEPAVEEGSPFSMTRTFWRSASVITPKSMATLPPGASGATAVVTRFWISLRRGHPGTVSTTVSDTPLADTLTSRTMPRSTMERCSSGSSTGRSASMICSTVAVMGFSVGVSGEFALRR